MKLHAEQSEGNNTITSYGPGFVTINGKKHESSLIVSPNLPPQEWPVARLADLTTEHMAGLDLACDVILLGTGARQIFPPRSLFKPLLDKKIGVEVMDTAAACRTYNLLLAEGRAVVAALIVE